MIIPNIQSGEIWQGYEGRLRHLNPEVRGPGFYTALSTHLGMPSSTSKMALIAAAAGQDVLTLERKHSLMPVTALTVNGIPKKAGAVMNGPHRGVRAHFCRLCVAEDLSAGQFSFWHREHQLHGANWCPKHRCALTSVAKERAFDQLPHWLLDASIDEEPPADIEEWPALRRFLEIQVGMLELPGRFPRDHVLRLTSRAGQLKNYRMTYGCQGRRISDTARELLPIPWLKRHFPLLARKERRQWCVFDNVIRRGTNSPGHSIALALAILFPTSKEALTALRNAVEQPDQSPVQPRTPFPDEFWCSREFLATYAKFRGNTAAIAIEFDSKPAFFHRQLKRLGLLWEGGDFPHAEICEILNLDVATTS